MSSDLLEDNIFVLIIILSATFIAALCVCCLRKLKNRNKVKVLSVAGSAGYKDAFEFFAKTEMDLCVEWANKRKQGDKYLLLCKIVTRIPEEIRGVLQKMDPNVGRSLDDETMIVAMYDSEGEREDIASDFIEHPDIPMRFLRITHMFYRGNFMVSCSENIKAKHGISSFLS